MAVKRFSLYRGKPNVSMFPEAASQSFNAGDLVYLVSGRVTICTGTAQGALGIFGVACRDGVTSTGTAYPDTPVMVITPEQEWRAYPATTVVPSTGLDAGVGYKVAQSSAGAGVLGAAGSDCVVVKLKAMGQDGGTAGDPVIIRFCSTACQSIEGS